MAAKRSLFCPYTTWRNLVHEVRLSEDLFSSFSLFCPSMFRLIFLSQKGYQLSRIWTYSYSHFTRILTYTCYPGFCISHQLEFLVTVPQGRSLLSLIFPLWLRFPALSIPFSYPLLLSHNPISRPNTIQFYCTTMNSLFSVAVTIKNKT